MNYYWKALGCKIINFEWTDQETYWIEIILQGGRISREASILCDTTETTDLVLLSPWKYINKERKKNKHGSLNRKKTNKNTIEFDMTLRVLHMCVNEFLLFFFVFVFLFQNFFCSFKFLISFFFNPFSSLHLFADDDVANFHVNMWQKNLVQDRLKPFLVHAFTSHIE